MLSGTPRGNCDAEDRTINAGRGTVGKLVRNDSLYDDLRGTARHADSMIVGRITVVRVERSASIRSPSALESA